MRSTKAIVKNVKRRRRKVKYVVNVYPDGKETVAAFADKIAYLNYIGTIVATVNNGNLHIKGKLHEKCDLKKLVILHYPDKEKGKLWPTPVFYYDGKLVSAFFNEETFVPYCFWDETDFYVWNKLEEENKEIKEGDYFKFVPSGETYITSIRGRLIIPLTDQTESNNDSTSVVDVQRDAA